MSTVTSHQTTGPFGEIEECSKFVISDERERFTLLGVTHANQEYTFSFWIRSENSGSIIVDAKTVRTDLTWKRETISFIADGENFTFDFDSAGTYYIYHPQIELGNIATDWRASPLDVDENVRNVAGEASEALTISGDNSQRLSNVESTIKQLAESISMLVRDSNGGTLLRQDANGLYYFDISEIEHTISNTANDLNALEGLVFDANGKLDILQSTAEALKEKTEYVKSYTDENDQPCLELGEGDSAFKVYITNTQIRFADGTTTPAYISNQKLMIEKAQVKDELQFGNFVWKARNNGNMGLIWIGGN